VIQVLLVDDHDLFREGVRRILESEEGIEVVGDVGDGLAATEAVERLRPDVVLMDVNMPNLDGITATRNIIERFPETRVIFLTAQNEDRVALRAIQAGASGYLLKNVRGAEVARAIRAAAVGASHLDPMLTARLLVDYRRLVKTAESEQANERLTETEVAMLQYVTAGLSNREIGERLGWSEPTIKNKLSQVFTKIGVRDRTQAAVYALTRGIAASN
jgi:two-component system, NarL family, response regulator DegU